MTQSHSSARQGQGGDNDALDRLLRSLWKTSKVRKRTPTMRRGNCRTVHKELVTPHDVVSE